MKRNSTFGALLALAALAAPVGAQAAEAKAACMTEEEISSLAIYAVPSLISAAQTSCIGRLPARGFLSSGGTAMAQRYAARREAVWPKARSALFKFGSTRDKDIAMFANLPDEAIRPLMDALIEQEVASEIKPGSCRNIERMAEVLAMLEPEAAGALTGVIAALALGDEEKPRICPARTS
jgi:hypothetical protein